MKDQDLKILIKAAHAGGKVLKRYFGKTFTVVEKSSVFDLQTEADIKSEKAILKILKTKFPQYNIYSEEEGKTDNHSDYVLVIDPLDGTNNFTLGIPSFCVSVALLYKGQAIAGIIYQPIIDQTFYAVKGKGAYLNNKKIRVNNVLDKKKITIGYHCGYKTALRTEYVLNIMAKLIKAEYKRIMRNWCPTESLCLLASGKIESGIFDKNEIYDFAAGKLIAQEAGAEVLDFSGKKEISYINDRFIIGNNKQTNIFAFDMIKTQKNLTN